MDSGDPISKAVFTAQTSYAKKLTMQPRYWKINISVCKLASHLLFSLHIIKYIFLKTKRIKRGNYKYMISAPIYGPHSKQEKFH